MSKSTIVVIPVRERSPSLRSRVLELAHGPEPVLVVAQHSCPRRAVSGDRPRSPPREPSTKTRRSRQLYQIGPRRSGCLRPRAGPEAGGGAGTERDLGHGFKLGEAVTRWPLAVPAVLGRQRLHRAGDRTITEPLEAPLLHREAMHPARAAR